MINFCLSFWSFRNSSTVRLSTVFFSKIKSQAGECVLCSFLIMQDNHSISGTTYTITRELMTFKKSNNPDFKSESYSIKLHRQSLSQLSNEQTRTHSGSSSGSHPSSSFRQKKHCAVSGLFSHGVWINPALAIYRTKKDKSIKDENTAFQHLQIHFSILTDQSVSSRFLECKCSPLQTANQRMFEVCSHKSTF